MSESRSRTIAWSDPLITVKGAHGKTGLELLEAIRDGLLPQAPISATLGFVLVAVEKGFARFEGDTAEYQYNPMATVHGGVAATMLDSAMGCAVMSMLDAKHAYTTAQLSIHLTRAMTDRTGRIAAEGRIVHSGSRIATAEGRLIDSAGTVLAHGSTTCLVFERPGVG
jgi:uncharacterized protein (TIGR00369 family)